MIGLALCLLGFLYYINPKSIEPPPRVETLTDLSNLLIRWEKHASEDSAVALGKLAAQLDRAGELLEAADHARPPPAASPCPSCPSCPACPATTASLAGAAAGAGAGAASEAALLHALATAGVQCHAGPAELWGEPLVWGSVHRTPSAAECCAACAAHAAAAARGGLEEGVNSTACNTWVHCSDKARCGDKAGECWLKHQKAGEMQLPAQRGGAGSMWTSGVVYPGDAFLAPYDKKVSLTLTFEVGAVQVTLLPDLAPTSVRELRRLVALLGPGGHCTGCRLYRVEPHFLVQGVISHPGGYVATPRNPNPPQKKIMERGLVCWAGGMGGPDFFVNIVDNAGFGDSHLCWGKVDDMALLDKIVAMPQKPKAKQNDMTFLQHELQFNMTLA